MTVTTEAAERLSERLAPFGPDPLLDAYCMAHAVLFKRSQEVLRHDEHGSGWRRLLDPDRTPDWALPWLAQLVGSPRLIGLSTAQQRAVIREAPGLRRGTLQAIAQAARVHLTDPENALVDIIERDGSAYALAVHTYAGETPSPALVEAALLEAKPVGLTLTYVVSDGWFVGIFEALVPSVGDLEGGSFIDVDAFEDHVPS